jgi:hypothetical protein
MKKILLAVCSSLLLSLASCGGKEGEKIYYARDFGVVPGTGEDMTEEPIEYIDITELEEVETQDGSTEQSNG